VDTFEPDAGGEKSRQVPQKAHGAEETGTDLAASSGSSTDNRAEVLGMARQGGLNSGGAVFNQILRFGTTFLIVRLLGAAAGGLYFQAFAFLSLLGLVSSGGFTLTLTRYVAIHRADGDEGALRGTVRLGLITSTVIAVMLGVGLYIASTWLAESLFHEARFAVLLRFSAAALPVTVFTDAALSATQGFKTMTPYALINLFFEPACRIILTAGALALGWGLSGAMVALLITNSTSACLASIALKRLMGKPTTVPRYDIREIFAFSGLSWFSNLASNGLLWADTLILGIYGSPAQVGIYQVATRLTLLGTALINPVTTSFSPRIADLWRRKEYALLSRSYRLITSWVFRMSLPSFVVLLIFPRQLLAIFGPRFEVGVPVTVIMTVAWMFNALSGPCGYMLTMSGRPMSQMINNLLGLTLNLGLNVWLIPRHGVVGAAIAWAVTIAFLTLARTIEVWTFTKMLPLSSDLLKGAWAGLAAAAVGQLTQEIIGGRASLPVGIVAVGLTYVGVIVLLGLDSDDRLVLNTLRRRVRPRRT
jgi:O-antigen/teichoic acid export membrane protein